MGKEEILSGLILELRRGTIVLCVLAKLHQPMYGYALVRALSESGVRTEANTLYPLMRRLESQGVLHSSWQVEGSKPRKYYHVTPLGREIYTILKEQWTQSAASVRAILDQAEANHNRAEEEQK